MTPRDTAELHRLIRELLAANRKYCVALVDGTHGQRIDAERAILKARTPIVALVTAIEKRAEKRVARARR